MGLSTLPIPPLLGLQVTVDRLNIGLAGTIPTKKDFKNCWDLHKRISSYWYGNQPDNAEDWVGRVCVWRGGQADCNDNEV